MGECHDIIFYQPLSPLMDKLNSTVDTMEDSYLLQRFIHENLARVTKIVGHVVDGIHRVTALDYVLTGTRTHDNEEEEKAIKNYGDSSPHQDKKVTMTIYTPQKIDEELLTFMKALSSRIQCSANKQTPHNIRDILCNEIKILAKKCDSDDDGVPHLWSCLGVVFNVLAGRIVEMSERQINIMRKGIHRDSMDGQRLLDELEHLQTPVTGASMGRILEDYISFWVENMSQKIIHQLGHSSHRSEFQTLSSFDNEGNDERDESARRLFKYIYQVNNQTKSKYHIFPCKPRNMQINSFLGAEADAFIRATGSTSDFSSVFKEDRFKRKDHNDVEFMVSQVLVLSRTCYSTQTCLTKLFSSLRPEFKQYTSAGYDDAMRWMANYIHNASDSVYKSYPPWKSAFFVLDKNYPVQCLPEQVIYLCLWGSAIEECAGFFSKLGMKAQWPRDLLPNRGEIEQALDGERHSDIMSPSRVGEGGSGPDLLTYITISHALSSSRMGRGMRKQIQSARLSRSSLYGDIVRYPKARDPSNLCVETIGGNDTADPRGREVKRLINIVSHGKVNNFDQETHFTANIGEHYDLLLGGVDTAYSDALHSLNSIKEDDNMDDDNVSMVDDDVDSSSPLYVVEETEAHHAPLVDEEDVGIIENGEGNGGGGGLGVLEDDIIDEGHGGGGGEGGEGGEGDDNNLSVVGGGEGGDDGGENENEGGGGGGRDDGENENGGGGGDGGDDGGENEIGGGGGEARGNRRSSRAGRNPNPISGVGGGGGPRRRRADAGQGPASGRRRDGIQPRGGARAQPNDEIPEGASVASDESLDGMDARLLAKSLEMMKIFDDLVGLGLFDEYKCLSDIEHSITAYENYIPQETCTVPSCGEYNHPFSRLCENHMTQFITLETKPEEITPLQAAYAEVGAVGDAFENNVYLARATRDGGDDDDQNNDNTFAEDGAIGGAFEDFLARTTGDDFQDNDNSSFSLFAPGVNDGGGFNDGGDGAQSDINELGEIRGIIVGLMVEVRQEFDVQQEDVDEASLNVADFLT